jgi:hypothetical protein
VQQKYEGNAAVAGWLFTECQSGGGTLLHADGTLGAEAVLAGKTIATSTGGLVADAAGYRLVDAEQARHAQGMGRR